jgi:HPt (histidine-containing phosphotransfer) domain-containing protein
MRNMKNRSYHFIDLRYLEKMSAGDIETKKLLLEMLIEELQSAVLEMRVLYRQKKWPELLNVSHKMKSTLAFTGNKELIEANRSFWQQVSERKDMEVKSHCLDLLESRCPVVISELKEEYAKIKT